MDGYDLDGATLKISVDLDLDARDDFQTACEQLVKAPGDPLYLDLSRVNFIGSSFFGQMFTLNYQIKKEGRTLIVRTSPKLMSIMELLGLPQLVKVELVESDSSDVAAGAKP